MLCVAPVSRREGYFIGLDDGMAGEADGLVWKYDAPMWSNDAWSAWVVGQGILVGIGVYGADFNRCADGA